MGADVDLQDDRILGAREVVEGLAAPRTPTLIGGECDVLGDGRELGIVAPLWARLARLLATTPTRRRVGRGGERGGGFGRGGRLGLAAEELLLTQAQPGLKPGDLGLELGLAIEGAAMHGLPIGGLPPRLELLLQAGQTGQGPCGRDGAEQTGPGDDSGATARSGVGPVPRP